MPGSIVPLPVMLEEEDRKIYENLEAPKSIVVRYGYQRLIAELPYDGQAKPGCGSKLVVRTQRGIEIGEMLTTTCPNAGCAKSVSRKQMLEYVENSGGKDYPFTDQGRIMRVASVDDMNEQAQLDARKSDLIKLAKRLIAELDLPMKLVEVELLLGGDRIIFYYSAEDRVDFRELVRKLAEELQTRIDMHQVNAREEARLVADYEKCGQHCCCKQFLKVLKPVSMRAAKVQKATLDPQKISGRCGRLMCCLRYEDQTYSDLRKRLPNRKSLVETDDGIGVVLDTQILTQLALVRIGATPPAAYPVENIRVLSKEEAKAYREATPDDPAARGGKRPPRPSNRSGAPASNRPVRRPKAGEPLRDEEVESKEGDKGGATHTGSSGYRGADENASSNGESDNGQSAGQPKRRRRRRRRRRGGGGDRKQDGGSGGES